MNSRDIQLLGEAYGTIAYNEQVDPAELKHAMTDREMTQQDYDAPYAVVYHGQAREWYGNGDPDEGRGRYKNKGDCGSVLAINIGSREQANSVRDEMESKLRERDGGEEGVNYSVCYMDPPEVVRMSDLGKHFYEYDEEYQDKYTRGDQAHDREFFKDFKYEQ